jgi:hypothetical protein
VHQVLRRGGSDPCPGLTGALADDEELELDERSRAARDLLRSSPGVKPRPASVWLSCILITVPPAALVDETAASSASRKPATLCICMLFIITSVS